MTGSLERYREAERRLWMACVGSLPSEHTVALPRLGSRVRLLEYGHGPTLLFVHGGPNAASTWAPLVKRLPDFRCVLLERPGCGLSELPATPAKRVRQQMVDLLDDALAALDSQPAAIVASSFGSFATLAFAVAQPARV
ncbi:MAG TPA: alpha/beta hydrolase, partial [Roseiflexaceae bacterium]|nr:alpha/beta hydrolase [Roseiflexaceae bacterium]